MRTQGDPGSIPGLGRSPVGGHGNPLQYSCLENPHGQRSLVGYSPWGRKESDTTEQLNAHTHWHLKTFWQVLCQAVCNSWVCLGNLKWTQRVSAANSQPPEPWAAQARDWCYWDPALGAGHGAHVCVPTCHFCRVSFFKALMAWPQHLLHFLKTDRHWSCTCSSHEAALSRNDRTHAEAGQLPRQGQPSRLGPELSQCCQGGPPLGADSAAGVELCQPHSSSGAAGKSQMFC